MKVKDRVHLAIVAFINMVRCLTDICIQYCDTVTIALPDGTLVESLPRIATDNKGRTKTIGGGAMYVPYSNSAYPFNHISIIRLWEFIEQRDEQQWQVEDEDETD